MTRPNPLHTHVSLPPGPLGPEAKAALVPLVLDELGWIAPRTYGKLRTDRPVPDDPAARRTLLVTKLAEWGVLELAEGKITLGVVPDHGGIRSRASYVLWRAPEQHPALTAERHPHDVWRLMRLTGAPLAVAALATAYDAFATRWVPAPHGGTQMQLTVRDYACGLTHPHFRLWLGPEWTAFLGPEHLARAPAYRSEPLDGGGWFVQVLAQPGDWDQPAGLESAARFAAALPARVFYDPADPDRALAAPPFPPIA